MQAIINTLEDFSVPMSALNYEETHVTTKINNGSGLRHVTVSIDPPITLSEWYSSNSVRDNLVHSLESHGIPVINVKCPELFADDTVVIAVSIDGVPHIIKKAGFDYFAEKGRFTLLSIVFIRVEKDMLTMAYRAQYDPKEKQMAYRAQYDPKEKQDVCPYGDALCMGESNDE